MTLSFKVKTSSKDDLFNDFKNGLIAGVRRKWKRRKLKKPTSTSLYFRSKKNCLYFYFKGYDKFYHKSYPFTAKYGLYSIYYCHHKDRDDYILVNLQHNAVKNKSKDEIYEDTLILLERIGIDIKYLKIDNKLNRIDYKHDFECEYNPIAEKQAIMCICSKARNSYNGVCKEELKDGAGIKYKPQSSYIEIIVYDKEQERKERFKSRKKTLHLELEIKGYINVFRIELRLKSKRLYYNIRHTLKINKTLDSYYNEEVADECFKRYVEPIFYKEPFYRIDYAILAIQTDRRLSETEAEKLCNLVIEINKKGFTEARNSYKYSDDTFDKHIKLLRSIDINPITFDEDVEISFLLNFTTKEVCRDFTINDEEHEELKQKLYDEFWGGIN